MAPASLMTLPNELLLQICSYQCRHCFGKVPWPGTPFMNRHKTDLGSLSLTCRRLCHIAQPMLFHDAHPTNILHLFRTVIERPDLALEVRGFCNDECGVSKPLEEDLYMLETEALRFGLEKRDQWLAVMQNDKIECGIWLLELTLAQLPNVVILSITLPYEYEYGFGNLFRRSVVLNSVRRLALYHGDYNTCSVDLGRLGDFLGMMPRLESLETNRCGGATQHLPLNELRSLVFTQGNLSVASLKRLVSSCPKLERFEYWSPGGFRNIGDEEDEDEREFTWGQGQRILYERRKTLKHLNFEFHNYFPRFSASPFKPGDFLGSFRGFSALEVLLVRVCSFRIEDDGNARIAFPASVEALVGTLPESLTLLGICGLQARWDGVDKLTEAIRRGHFPRLQRVVLDQDGAELEASRELLATVGVRCLKYDYKHNPIGRCSPIKWSLRLS